MSHLFICRWIFWFKYFLIFSRVKISVHTLHQQLLLNLNYLLVILYYTYRTICNIGCIITRPKINSNHFIWAKRLLLRYHFSSYNRRFAISNMDHGRPQFIPWWLHKPYKYYNFCYLYVQVLLLIFNLFIFMLVANKYNKILNINFTN